jgi:hypothetical protein
MYLESRHGQPRWFDRNVLWLALAPAGILLYTAYLGLTFGDPLAFMSHRNVNGWGAESWPHLEAVLNEYRSFRHTLTQGMGTLVDQIHLVLGLAGVLVVTWRRRELPWSFMVLVWANLFMALVGNWFNAGRYMLPVFPIYIALALTIQRPLLQFAVVYLSSLLLALFTILYSRWFWVS